MKIVKILAFMVAVLSTHHPLLKNYGQLIATGKGDSFFFEGVATNSL